MKKTGDGSESSGRCPLSHSLSLSLTLSRHTTLASALGGGDAATLRPSDGREEAGRVS